MLVFVVHRSQGLEVSAMMDRRRSSTPQGQVGFIKFILRPTYNMFARLVPEASKPLEILNQNLEYWQVQQTLMSQQRKKRARSLGAITQIPAMIMIQDELKNLNNADSDDHDDDDDVDDDYSALYLENGNNESVESPIKARKKTSNKKVGFKDTLVIRDAMSDDLESEEDFVGTPHTTMSCTSHSYHGSAFSGDDSYESLPLSKVRAHSIHIPIPTSEKQIASQPRPFNSFMAELRKDYLDEEDEKSELKRREKRRERLLVIVKKSKSMSTPTVTQSVSVPMSAKNVDAAISPKNNGYVGNKQVFDVV